MRNRKTLLKGETDKWEFPRLRNVQRHREVLVFLSVKCDPPKGGRVRVLLRDRFGDVVAKKIVPVPCENYDPGPDDDAEEKTDKHKKRLRCCMTSELIVAALPLSAAEDGICTLETTLQHLGGTITSQFRFYELR